MLENISTSLAAGSTGVALAVVLTVPAITSITSHLRTPKPGSDIYEDKDGVATEKSVSEYSAKIPKIFLGIFTIAGLFTSIALAVLGTIDGRERLFVENWLNVAQWVGPVTIGGISELLTFSRP